MRNYSSILPIPNGDYQLFYYRDHDQYGVDVVAENAAGQLVAWKSRRQQRLRKVTCVGLSA